MRFQNVCVFKTLKILVDNFCMFCVKKYSILFAFFLIFSRAFCGEYNGRFAFEFGLGTGFVSYGSEEAKAIQNESSTKAVVCADFSALFPLEKRAFFSLGADCLADIRSGDKTCVLLDYAFLLGFRVYPNLAGLFACVDYALGRRTDFVGSSVEENSSWGNGFRFGLGYDFSYHKKRIAPEACFCWRRMPRGDGADNLVGVRFRLKF